MSNSTQSDVKGSSLRFCGARTLMYTCSLTGTGQKRETSLRSPGRYSDLRRHALRSGQGGPQRQNVCVTPPDLTFHFSMGRKRKNSFKFTNYLQRIDR